jgi:hypothetical protein
MNMTSQPTQHEPVLSRSDLDFFHENGYIVVPNAVPEQNRENLINTIFEFLGVDRNNPTLGISRRFAPAATSRFISIKRCGITGKAREFMALSPIFTTITNCGSASTAPPCARRNAQINHASTPSCSHTGT